MTIDVDVLFSAEQINERVAQLAVEIAEIDPSDLLVVPILKGSFVFAADLIRALHGSGLEPEIDFLMLSSYGSGTSSSGHINIVRDVEAPLTDRDVLLVDDILESGRTLAHAKGLIQSRGAGRVSTCVLLNKPVTRAEVTEPDFTGFACPNTFVIGYGMDLNHKFRELPYIGRIRQDSARS